MQFPPRAPSLVTGACIALITSFCSSLGSSDALAITRRVPSEYPTIQTALDASITGDQVLVAPGVYQSSTARTLVGSVRFSQVTAIAFVPPGISLISEAGAAATTLNGGGSAVGIVLYGGRIARPVREVPPSRPSEYLGKLGSIASDGLAAATMTATIRGFTVLNAPLGIYAEDVLATIEENEIRAPVEVRGLASSVFRANAMLAAGVFCYTTSAEGVTWTGNSFGPGGGATCRCRRGLWTENSFATTGPLSLWAFNASDAYTVSNNSFVGTGIDAFSGELLLTNNTIRDYFGFGVAGIEITGGSTGLVAANVIENCAWGMTLGGAVDVTENLIDGCVVGISGIDLATVRQNRILNSGACGICSYLGNAAAIENNEIRGSGDDGINIELGTTSITGNLVVENDGEGIVVLDGLVSGNIVAFNGGDGMRIGFGPPPDGTSRRGVNPTAIGNTVAGNGGAGIVITGVITATIERNIVAFNGAEGVRCPFEGAQLAILCNDSYGNVAADFADFCADAASMGGNFSLDPQFCNIDAADFGLSANSPCAPPNSESCGLVGAVPVGCASALSPERFVLRPASPNYQGMSWGRIKGRYRY